MGKFLLMILFATLLASCQEVARTTIDEEQKQRDVRKYISKYLKQNKDLSYEDSMFRSQQPKDIGDVNGDGKPDTVFILSPLDSGEYYFSYYFFDTTIPRIQTITYCTENTGDIFRISDIDEDGSNEIGLLQFSCNGRTQSLGAYSLKNDSWITMGTSTYDMNFEDILPKEQRIIKTGKGKFQMLHVLYDAVNDTLIKEWRRFSLQSPTNTAIIGTFCSIPCNKVTLRHISKKEYIYETE